MIFLNIGLRKAGAQLAVVSAADPCPFIATAWAMGTDQSVHSHSAMGSTHTQSSADALFMGFEADAGEEIRRLHFQFNPQPGGPSFDRVVVGTLMFEA